MTQPVSKTPAVVKRLREGAIWRDDGSEVSPDPTDALLTEAANTIQRLERERDEARGGVHSHAGDTVTWERLRTSHSSMLGIEPWQTQAPNEGHRVYKQSASEACYMCAALALIEHTEARAQLAEDRLKVAREALKPFANFVRSSLWPDDGSEGDETYQLTFNPPGTLGDIKGSDFRCARQALLSTGEA